MDYFKPIKSHRRKPNETDGAQHLTEGEGNKACMCCRCERARLERKKSKNYKFSTKKGGTTVNSQELIAANFS